LASAIVGGIILTSVALYHTIPEFANRMKSAVTHLRNDAPKNEEDSNAIRYLVWREARALIADYPILGVGAGDVNAKLKQRYIDAGLWTAPQRGLNAHSQFYQTHLAAGIAGTFFLLAILLTAIRAGRFRGLALFFGLLVVSNLLVEAMLERQAGVVFIVFFAVLLVYQPDKKAW
jgi:O-antigen ligase